MDSMDFAFTFISFLGLNLLVAANSFFFTSFLLNKEKDAFKPLFAIFLLFVLQISLSEIALGVLSILNQENLWLIHGTVFILNLLLWYKWKPEFQLPRFSKKGGLSVLLILSPIVFLFTLRYFYAFYHTPLDYDSISYHLPIAVEWLQTGGLKELYYNAFAGPLAYYPSNFELLELWTLFPFHNDLFINFINFPIFIFLGLAFFANLQSLKVKRTAAIWGTLFFLATPQFCHLLGYANVDLFFTLTFLLSVFFLLEYQKEQSRANLILFSISIGFFLGTKYLGVPYFVPLLAYLFGWIVFKNWKHKKTILKHSALLLFFAVLGGGYWYLRNHLNSGNPLFPTEVKVMGYTLLEGYYGLTERIFNTSLLSNVHTLGAVKEFASVFYLKYGFALFLFPCICFTTLFSIVRKNFSKTQGVLLLGTLIFLYLYWSAPYSYGDLLANTRYAMVFMAMSILWMTHHMQTWGRVQKLFYGIVAASTAYNILVLILIPPSESGQILLEKIPLDLNFIQTHLLGLLGFVALLGLMVLSGIIFSNFLNKKSLKTGMLLATTLMLLTVGTTAFFYYSYQARESTKEVFFDKAFDDGPLQIPSLLKAAEWFDQNAPEAKIAYTGSSFHYYFFGPTLERQVDYVNINDCATCRYLDYKNSPDSIRRDPNFEDWLNNLNQKEKEYIVIAENVVPQVRLWELEWVKQNPEVFTQVFQSNAVSIYEIHSK